MTPFEVATIAVSVAQLVLIGAGLAMMEAGGRRRARAEERRHAEAMAAIDRRHQESMARHEQVMAALGKDRG